MHKNTRSTGSCYERKAADYLKQQGLFILRYNYRCRFGEIDLIARDGEYVRWQGIFLQWNITMWISHAVSMWQELTGMKYTGLRMRLNILQSANNYRNCFDE